MKQCRNMLLALLLICAMVPSAFAARQETIQPMWLYLTDISGDLDISSGGLSSVSASAYANPRGEVARMTLTASLQQYVSGTWKEVKVWTASNNSASVNLGEKAWQVHHGYSYRLVITTKAYNDNALLEQASKTINYGYFA